MQLKRKGTSSYDTNDSLVVTKVSDGDVIGCDAEANFYAEAMDDVLSYDSSFVSNEHTDQDDVSGSVNKCWWCSPTLQLESFECRQK